MRLGLASLLVALLLLLSPSRPSPDGVATTTTTTTSVSLLVGAVTPPYDDDNDTGDDDSRSSSSSHFMPDYYEIGRYGRQSSFLHNRLDDGNGSGESFEASIANKKKMPVGNLKTEPLFKKKHLTVGYLPAVKGELKERQGLQISGAIQMALDQVNNDSSILPNVTLDLKWFDTRGDPVVATKAMTDMICEGVSAFFGPEGTCHVEAIVSQARNIPMISYKCSDYKASEVPTFARTEPPDTQVTKSVISLLTYYKWTKFSIIYQNDYTTVARSLAHQAKQNNMTVKFVKEAIDRHKCCQENLSCCQIVEWYKIIQDTKNRTRIYVFLGTHISLMELMNIMQTQKMFEKGEYFVIFVDMNTYSDKQADQYLWEPLVLQNFQKCEDMPDFKSFVKRAKSLFVVAPTAPTENFKSFAEQVQIYNNREPFSFKVSNILKTYETYITVYAAYLFDSVKLYASALHYLLSQHTVLTDEIIEEVASNGTKIIETIIKINKTYKSITGAMMKLDKNGDSEGNYSVIAFSEPKYKTVRYNFTCPFQMRPVGQFYQSEENTFPSYEMNSNTQIQWAGGNCPIDEPSCGFDNELCPKPNTQLNSIITAGVLAIILFCAGVFIMSIYRKWKIEQEIEGLLWKISRDEIHTYSDRDNIISSPSRVSLCSASVASYESRGGLQVFATTAQYRGVVVRIKELTFSRKKDISREVMKEMRLLRELRHDNVNSFIGACVQPTSLLLVTDYCAKGSLYDIIENEDIKLDKMFIASLVHDLIKGMLYIHNSMLGCHGNLKSSNCVVTSRWVLQVTDFGLAEMRHCAENDLSIGEHQYYRSMFWKAPEILRHPNQYIKGTQKGDVYSFGIILYEILGRRGPFGVTGYEPKDIIELVKRVPQEGEEPFRPDTDMLLDTEICCDEYILQTMKDCWSEYPEYRPDFAIIRSRLKRMKDGKNMNIMDQMIDMMVTYANNLEELVNERTLLLYEEKMKTEDLLHRMLPKPVAEKLTKGLGVEPESFDQVTIYFSDIVGFTAMSAESTPLQVVNFLNDLYTIFDGIIKGYDVYKVETIGDAYMVVSGLPIKNGDRHAGEIASMALDLLAAVKNHSIAHRPKETLKLRIGIHTGPVVAGVVGLTMPRYCLFGDTVNTASRMESNGEALKIHISTQCKEALDKLGGYEIEERGWVSMKGKGEVRTFWLTGATEQAVQKRDVDLGELPPLFRRPRRSPKLNADSRQPSICGGFGGGGPGGGFGGGGGGGGGLHSRRHSSVPRDPAPPSGGGVGGGGGLLVGGGSRTTVNTAFGSQLIESPEETRKKTFLRTVLSSIASSSDEYNKSQGMLNRVRESKSLDPLPSYTAAAAPTTRLTNNTNTNRAIDLLDKYLRGPKRSAKSLENCDKCGEIQIIAIPEDKLFGTTTTTAANNNFPNGNLLLQQQQQLLNNDDTRSYAEDVQVPLLNHPQTKNNQQQQQPAIVRRRGGSAVVDDVQECDFSKRWRSLETVPASCHQLLSSSVENKKPSSINKNPVTSWFKVLFNGNGFKSSNASLKKSVLNDYNNLQPEKESIV